MAFKMAVYYIIYDFDVSHVPKDILTLTFLYEEIFEQSYDNFITSRQDVIFDAIFDAILNFLRAQG